VLDDFLTRKDIRWLSDELTLVVRFSIMHLIYFPEFLPISYWCWNFLTYSERATSLMHLELAKLSNWLSLFLMSAVTIFDVNASFDDEQLATRTLDLSKWVFAVSHYLEVPERISTESPSTRIYSAMLPFPLRVTQLRRELSAVGLQRNDSFSSSPFGHTLLLQNDNLSSTWNFWSLFDFPTLLTHAGAHYLQVLVNRGDGV
jgi:hypothetical protein